MGKKSHLHVRLYSKTWGQRRIWAPFRIMMIKGQTVLLWVALIPLYEESETAFAQKIETLNFKNGQAPKLLLLLRGQWGRGRSMLPSATSWLSRITHRDKPKTHNHFLGTYLCAEICWTFSIKNLPDYCRYPDEIFGNATRSRTTAPPSISGDTQPLILTPIICANYVKKQYTKF